MVIFDHSWYGRLLEERVERTIAEKEWRQAYRDIVEFVRMLADDGAIILKVSCTSARKSRSNASRPSRPILWRHGGNQGRLGSPQEM
jgi:polyphosphate kinase 2 (PPK2 family)